MKKFMISFIALFLVLSSVGSMKVSASSNMTIYINNIEQSYSKQAVAEKGTTLVPLRNIFQSIGAKVTWNAKTKTIDATKGKQKIWLKLGSKTAKVNGKNVTLAVPAKAVNGVTLVPLRFISEALGEKVRWHAESKSIFIGDINFYENLLGANIDVIKKYETSKLIDTYVDGVETSLIYNSKLFGRSSDLNYYFYDGKLEQILYDFMPEYEVHTSSQLKNLFANLSNQAVKFFGKAAYTEVEKFDDGSIFYYSHWEFKNFSVVLYVTDENGYTDAYLYLGDLD